MAVWRASITIMDNKRKLGRTSVWLNAADFPDETFTQPYEYLQAWYLPALDEIITGQIVNCSLAIEIPLAGLGLKSLPLSVSDRENGALFYWRGSVSKVLQSIPTFDEDFIIDGTDLVDLEAAEIAHFLLVSVLSTELPDGGFSTGVSDNRGLPMHDLESARERFKP